MPGRMSKGRTALADVLSLSLRGILMLGLDTSEPMVRLLAGGPTFFTTLPRLVGKDEAVLPLEPSPFLNLDLLSTSTYGTPDPNAQSLTTASQLQPPVGHLNANGSPPLYKNSGMFLQDFLASKVHSTAR